MCEFCHQHGEGKKWYLQAKNYSDDLLADLERRRFIERFLTDDRHLRADLRRLEWFGKLPRFIRGLFAGWLSARQQPVHFGQVVPIEEVEKIFGLVNSIVRLSCICRKVTTGREQRYCYGVALGPDGGGMAELMRGLDRSYLHGPDGMALEVVDKEATLAQFRDYERRGMCHTVWTMRTPFIGGICNCDRTDCVAMRATVTHGLPVMFKAEYITAVNTDSCTGCRACLRVCQFAALGYDANDRKVTISRDRCYGCGICRAACPAGALTLLERPDLTAGN